MNPIWRAFETQPDRAALPTPGQGTSTLSAPCFPTFGMMDFASKARAFFGGST